MMPELTAKEMTKEADKTEVLMEVDPSKLQPAPDPSKVGTQKYPLLTHEKVDTRPTKNIKMKQYLCVRHALPKTRLTNTILYENVSHERHLEMKVSSLSHRRGRTLNTMDINRRAFVAQQDRKRRKWKREDEVRLAAMNLPTLSPVEAERRPNVSVMYHSSENEPRSGSATVGRKPILPMMKIRKERTEIVLHRNKTFITKLPAVVEVDQHIQTVFDAYRGKAYLNRDLPSRDSRFTRLETLLGPSFRKEEDEVPVENITAKSRKVKHHQTDADSGPSQHAEARVMIASRGQSRDNSRPNAQNADYTTQTKSASTLRTADIIHSFKTQDIKELSKSLTRESHINPNDIHHDYERRQSNGGFAGRKTSLQHVATLGLKYEI